MKLEKCDINKVLITVFIVTIVNDPEKFSNFFGGKTFQSLTYNYTVVMLL